MIRMIWDLETRQQTYPPRTSLPIVIPTLSLPRRISTISHLTSLAASVTTMPLHPVCRSLLVLVLRAVNPILLRASATLWPVQVHCPSARMAAVCSWVELAIAPRTQAPWLMEEDDLLLGLGLELELELELGLGLEEHPRPHHGHWQRAAVCPRVGAPRS